MRDRLRRFADSLRQLGTRTLVIALAIFLITLVIASLIGNRIIRTEKTVLLQQGELNAEASAAEYNRYLLTRVNIVTLVGYSVDDMLASGADNAEIERYITDETRYIIAAIGPTTTGLYGWIGGEYLDGAGWEPDADYVATERPWYTKTLASDEAVTFVEPYLDAQTGDMMMTVSTLLNDGESVLAMDLSLDPIQQIVEDIASVTEYSQAFVLDVSGIVVIHSDEDQLGRNYLEESGTLGAQIAQRLLKEGQMQFDLDTDEGRYSVYVEALEGGWYSVSLINADTWYRPMYRDMFIFTLIQALLVIFLTFVFLHLKAKNRALQKLYIRIDQEERRGEKLQELSETDRMTGLYDRVSGERKVAELLATGIGGMFLELDIDHFKAINDSRGHQTGDKVILSVADALRSTFRTNDIVMRLGGDEFGVFAVGIVDREMGETIIRRLFRRLEGLEIPELGGEAVCISVGAALCRGMEAPAFSELYARADSAMYLSKKADGNSLNFSD